IVVHSQKKDVTNYLEFLKQEGEKQTNPQLKALITSYQEFVAQIVKKRNVLEKEFFIVVPFSPFELGISASGIANSLLRKKNKIPYPEDYVISKAKTAL